MNSECLLGKQYIRTSWRKNPKLCTVVDVLKTYNKAGELVKTRYVSEHEFLGQTVVDRDVCETTILRGEVTA